MSSITCVCGTEEDSWPTISCTKCLFLHHVKCVGNEGQDPNTFVCLPCKSFSVMPKSRESIVKQNDNVDHSGEEEDKESQETTHYTAIQSTPTCLTITSSKIDKISRNSSRKRRNKGKDDQRKVKKQRNDSTEIKSPIKPTNCFGPSKLQDAEILYKELAENIYSDGLTRMLNLVIQADLNKTSNNQVSLTNMETRKLKVQQSECRRLVTMDNIEGNEAIVEMRGSYMLQDEYEETIAQPLSPSSPQQQSAIEQHVFMYNGLEGLNICVDTRTHGNVSRFVRFSPNPNTELRHVVMNNNKVRLYLFTRWQLMAGDEVTLPITTFDDWCGGEKVEMSTTATSGGGFTGADVTCNKLLTVNEIDEKQQQDFRRLSPIKLTIPKPTTNPPQQQKTKQCGIEQSNNFSDNVDEMPPSIDNALHRVNNKSASICARSTTESGKVSSTPEQIKSKNRKRGRTTNRRPRDNQSSNDICEQQRDDQFDTHDNCDRQSTDSATTSHQSCDLTSQDDVTTTGGVKTVTCYDNPVEGVDSKNMKSDNISTPDTKSSKMKAKKNSKGAVEVPSWFVDDCTHPFPPFTPGCPPEGGFRVQIQIKEVALPSKSKSTNKPPKKHFLATARNDENLISETTEVESGGAPADELGLNWQKSPPTKKLFLRRYQQTEPPDQQQTSSSSHVLENVTNDADLTPATTAPRELTTCEDSASSSLGQPMAITVITTNRHMSTDPLFLATDPTSNTIVPNTPTPAKKKVSLTEYLRRRRTKPSDDKNKQQKGGEGTESPVQADEDSSSRASSSRKSSDERSSQQSTNERTESNPIPIIQLNSSRDCEKTKAAYSIACPPPPSFRINIDTPTKPPPLPSTPGADVKQRSSSLNHTTPRRREPSTDNALLPTPSLMATIRPGTAKSLLMNEKLSPHSSSGGPPPYNPTAPATMPRATPNKKQQQQQAINRCQSRGAVRKISSPTSSSPPIKYSLSSRTSADSIFNGRGRRNSPTHNPSWESPRHSSIIRIDEYSRRATSPPKYPPPPLDRGHPHQHPVDMFTEWDASSATFPSDPPHFTYAPAPSRSSPTHRGRSPPPTNTPPSHVDQPKNSATQSPFRRHTTDYYQPYNKRGSSGGGGGGGGGESSDKTKYYYASHESSGYHRR